VADVTAEHIKLTAAGMATIENIFDDQADEPAQVSCEITTNYDGTNVPITIDTASAIT
jgi:hypothetical protein